VVRNQIPHLPVTTENHSHIMTLNKHDHPLIFTGTTLSPLLWLIFSASPTPDETTDMAPQHSSKSFSEVCVILG
jgi:hypothetical protein